jgi:hypothetical protein
MVCPRFFSSPSFPVEAKSTRFRRSGEKCDIICIGSIPPRMYSAFHCSPRPFTKNPIKSFVPTMQVDYHTLRIRFSLVLFSLIIPTAWLYRELDWHVRWYQPYVVMSQGNARAEESVLLDYVRFRPYSYFLTDRMFTAF